MNGDAEDPYDILGTTPDATETEVKVAAAKAKRELNPDHFPDDEKRLARQKLYRVREAERAILEDREMEPVAGGRVDDEPTDGSSTGTDATEDTTPTADLSVEVDPARPTVGTSVSVRVVDGAGRPIPQARVVTDLIDQSASGADDDQTARTDGDGVATLVFDTAGRRRLVATAGESDDDRTFDPAEATVVVTRPTVTLSLETDTESVTAGSPVSFRVTDGDGAPVRGASVSVAGQTLSTDASGVASTRLEDSGTVRVRATKTEPGVRYEPATATIRVTPGGGIDLEVAGDESGTVERDRNGRLRVESGETVGFAVESEATGRPVDGATVAVAYAGGVESGGDNRAGPTARTSDDGTASLTFPEPGRATVRATDDDTESEMEVVVLRGGGGRQQSGAEPNSGFGGRDFGRLAARAVGTLLVVALGGVIGLVVVADRIPTAAVAVGGAVVAAGLLGYLWLVAR